MVEKPVIKVRLHKYGGRRAIGLIWQYGRQGGEVSSGTANAREAERAAGRLEEQLEQGNLPGKTEGLSITWKAFRKRYQDEWLDQLSRGSKDNWRTAANHFEAICKPRRVADISKGMLSKYRTGLEGLGISADSSKSYYAALSAGLSWAASMDLIDNVPKIRHRKSVKKTATIRTRVPTSEEFERMLEAVPRVRTSDVAEFQRFMRGLWWSSLRIDELNRLSWNPRSTLHVDLTGDLPLIVFIGGQKNKKDGFLPAPPQFWELVAQRGIPRSGRVFPIAGRNGQMTTNNIGRRIAKIGKSARVVIDPRTGKHASAHDLRAAALTRIADTASLSHTQALARHSDPKTTSQFYIRHQAEKLAEAMGW